MFGQGGSRARGWVSCLWSHSRQVAGLGLEPRCPDTETHTLGNEPGQGSAGNTSESRGSRGVKMLVSMGLSCGHTDWSRWGWYFSACPVQSLSQVVLISARVDPLGNRQVWSHGEVLEVFLLIKGNTWPLKTEGKKERKAVPWRYTEQSTKRSTFILIYQLCHLLAVCLWASYLTCFSLSLFEKSGWS